MADREGLSLTRSFATPRNRSATLLWAIVLGAALMLLGLAWLPSGDPTLRPLSSLLVLGLLGLTFVVPHRLGHTLTPHELKLGLKVGATGFLGYYTGNHQRKGEGRIYIHAFVSTTRDGVLVEFGRRSCFLAPAEITGLLSDLEGCGAIVTA